MSEPIYSVTVQFVGQHTRLIETKQFLFTSKDAEVDFVAEVGKQADESVVDRRELQGFGRGEFLLALNALGHAKQRAVNA